MMIFMGNFMMDRGELRRSIYEVMGEPTEEKQYGDEHGRWGGNS